MRDGRRYERVSNIVKLAIRLQGMGGGLTIADIMNEFGVKRRTAERMLHAVEDVFGGLDPVKNIGEMRRHWRLQSSELGQLVRVLPEELADLESAVAGLERAGLTELAASLRNLRVKLQAILRSRSSECESDLEMLMRTEGLAMRAGPRPRLQEGLLSVLREGIKFSRVVEFEYLAQGTGRQSTRCVQPYGVLYGNRAFLVGKTDSDGDVQLWRLANMSEARSSMEKFERDPAFHLQSYAKRSFGTFQEKPVEVVLCFNADAARDAAAFLFHPDQTVTENKDGSATVRFKAGGIEEMCWHLVTWEDGVTVEKPARLRRRLIEMCTSLAEHHSV